MALKCRFPGTVKRVRRGSIGIALISESQKLQCIHTFMTSKICLHTYDQLKDVLCERCVNERLWVCQ